MFAGMTGECLGLVHELAAAVGNSTHVLESVGGISARYLADNTTAEQATDCFMAAVQGVSRVLAPPNASPVTHVRVIFDHSAYLVLPLRWVPILFREVCQELGKAS